jgi:hypothetical protein
MRRLIRAVSRECGCQNQDANPATRAGTYAGVALHTGKRAKPEISTGHHLQTRQDLCPDSTGLFYQELQ